MAFTKSAVEELSSLHREPDWLRARRLTSFGIYEGLAVPDTKRQEDWRQVDLKAGDSHKVRLTAGRENGPPLVLDAD